MILMKDNGLGLTTTSECITLRWILLQENNNNFLNIFSLSYLFPGYWGCFQAIVQLFSEESVNNMASYMCFIFIWNVRDLFEIEFKISRSLEFYLKPYLERMLLMLAMPKTAAQLESQKKWLSNPECVVY